MTTAIGPSPTFHSSTLGARLVGAALAGCAACAGLAMVGAWTQPERIALGAGLAFACWLFAALAGVTLLAVFTGGRVDRLAPALLGESFGRMLLALTAGLGTYLLAAPDGKTFWISFLVAGLVSLIAETAWAMRTLNRFHAAGGVKAAAERGA